MFVNWRIEKAKRVRLSNSLTFIGGIDKGQ